MSRRVVITGLGAVTPIGIGVRDYWDGLLSGRCGVGTISLFDASDLPSRVAAEVKDFDSTRFFDRKKARLLSRPTQFGVASALLCLEDAQWNERRGDGAVGVATGISNSAQDVAEAIFDIVKEHGYKRTLPYFLTKAFPHSVATETGLMTGFQTNVMTFSTACTAGINALGYAAEEIRAGRCRAFLCTATDASITPCTIACFCRAGMVSCRNDDPARASRPFDVERDGGVIGEGAGSLFLEDYEHARQRGAPVYAELLGFGSSGVGYGATPDVTVPKGMVAAMMQALRSANRSPRHIEYVGCHGVSDPHLDVWETQALKETFGEHAYRIPMSSVKGAIGIPQSAAGMLQLVAAVMTLREGIVAPTANLENPDPACDLDYVPCRPRRNAIARALVLAHGFNGSDAAVVVEKATNP